MASSTAARSARASRASTRWRPSVYEADAASPQARLKALAAGRDARFALVVRDADGEGAAVRAHAARRRGPGELRHRVQLADGARLRLQARCPASPSAMGGWSVR